MGSLSLSAAIYIYIYTYIYMYLCIHIYIYSDTWAMIKTHEGPFSTKGLFTMLGP